MAIEGFDYKDFSQTLAAQAGDLLPDYFDKFQKDYVVNTLLNFSNLAGEALCTDPKLHFDAEQAMLITQIIAEWTFHKSVDVIKSGILPEYWDGILQKIAFTIFEVAKQALTNKLPTEAILQVVEKNVHTAYEAALNELKNNGIIDDTLFESAAHQSNIDAMMEKIQEEKDASENTVATPPPSDAKLLKLASLALLLTKVPQEKVSRILSRFTQPDVVLIIQYMQMADLEQKVDKNIAAKFLKEIRLNLPEPKKINPNKIITKINELAKEKGKIKIDVAIKKERANVQFFINNAYEGEFSRMPAKVASIIAQHIEERV